jgi:hypothetical protein
MQALVPCRYQISQARHAYRAVLQIPLRGHPCRFVVRHDRSVAEKCHFQVQSHALRPVREAAPIKTGTSSGWRFAPPATMAPDQVARYATSYQSDAVRQSP